MSATDDLVARGFDGRELVVCVEGPRSGAWYFLDDWRERRRIAADHDRETPTSSSVLGYIPGRRMQPHPRTRGVEGHVLLWDPPTAAAALKVGTRL